METLGMVMLRLEEQGWGCCAQMAHGWGCKDVPMEDQDGDTGAQPYSGAGT